MKVCYLNTFIRNELKVQSFCQWFVQVEAFMETQCYALDMEQLHSIQTLLKDHALDCG
jgi:hypothetical protein